MLTAKVLFATFATVVTAPSASDITAATTALASDSHIELSGSSIRVVPTSLVTAGVCATQACWLGVNSKSPMELDASARGDARYSIRSYRLWHGKSLTQRQNADLVAEDVLQTVPREWYDLARWQSNQFQVIPKADLPVYGYPSPVTGLYILWTRAGMLWLVRGEWEKLRGKLGQPVWSNVDATARSEVRAALSAAGSGDAVLAAFDRHMPAASSGSSTAGSSAAGLGAALGECPSHDEWWAFGHSGECDAQWEREFAAEEERERLAFNTDLVAEHRRHCRDVMSRVPRIGAGADFRWDDETMPGIVPAHCSFTGRMRSGQSLWHDNCDYEQTNAHPFVHAMTVPHARTFCAHVATDSYLPGRRFVGASHNLPLWMPPDDAYDFDDTKDCEFDPGGRSRYPAELCEPDCGRCGLNLKPEFRLDYALDVITRERLIAWGGMAMQMLREKPHKCRATVYYSANADGSTASGFGLRSDDPAYRENDRFSRAELTVSTGYSVRAPHMPPLSGSYDGIHIGPRERDHTQRMEGTYRANGVHDRTVDTCGRIRQWIARLTS